MYRFLDIKRKQNPGLLQKLLNHIYMMLIVRVFFTYFVHKWGNNTNFSPQYKKQINVYNLITPQTKQNNGWSNFLSFIPAGTVIYNIEQFQVLVVFLLEVLVFRHFITKRCKI